MKKKKIIQTLFKRGATIQEINTIRKHLSYARGGFLAKYAYPAQVISLVFSDVPGGAIEFIASGPTARDTTTVADAERILAEYSVLGDCGLKRCGLIETPKDDKYFKNVFNILIVSNDRALLAMQSKARNLGFETKICDTCLVGEARLVGEKIVSELHNAQSKTSLLYGGETTVMVKGNGRGGRNQELILSALRGVKDDEIIVSFASDGKDNGEYAGAIADKLTKEKACKFNLDMEKYLSENNATPFFERTDDLIVTGITGSNVADLIVALKL